MRATAAALLAALLALNAPVAARAQEGLGTAGQDSTLASPGASDSTQVAGVIPVETTIGTPDSVFVQGPRSPILYQSSYSRDQSNGNWSQSLAYGYHRGPLAVSVNGSSVSQELLLSEGYVSRNREFTGQLDYRPIPRWVLTMSGRFDAVNSGSVEQGTRQRQNQIELRSQYSLEPWRGVSLRTLLSTSFEQEDNLSFNPERGVTGFTRQDSWSIDGRKDALSAQLDWRPLAGLTAMIQSGWNQATPTTKTVTRLIPAAGGGAEEPMGTTRTTPLPSSNALARVSFQRGEKLNMSLQMNRARSAREYFDALYVGTSGNRLEHIEQDLRSGTVHFQTQPARALVFSTDGILNETFSRYSLRTGSTNRARTRQLHSTLDYNRVRTRGSLRLEVSRAETEPTGNKSGVFLTRLLTGYAGRQTTRRLWLEGTGTATLTSRQYVYSPDERGDPNKYLNSDVDQVRSYFNLGAGYAVSSRCSTSVHFSTGRGHTVNVGAQRSGDNFVETNYQMDAMLRLKVTRTLSIQQTYSLSASYKIFDYTESKDFLTRIKRIDTVIADTLVPYVYASVTHNYQFFDSGPYARPSAGADRLYDPSSERYPQILTATLGLRSPAGINGFIRQSLFNTRIRTLSTGTETVSNRWTLTFGGDMRRTLTGGTELQVSASHVGTYTERPLQAQEESYWAVNAAVQKAF